MAYSALRLISILTNAVTVTPSIGHGFINQFTTLLAKSDSNQTASPEDDKGYAPIIYTSINGSSWSNKSYDLDGEVSWGTLMQIEDGFPEYIPKVRLTTYGAQEGDGKILTVILWQETGDFVTFRQYPTDNIVADFK